MAVPKYDEMMVPVLRRIAETPGDAVTSKQLRRFVIDYWGLSDNEVAETISSGFERYANNMLWACTYLKQAKCIESPKRGTYLVTQRGLDLVNSGVEKLDRQALMQFPEFCDFLNRSRKGKDVSAKETEETVAQPMTVEENESPEDTIDEAFRSIETALVSDILEAIMQQSPAFFERLVVQLLLAMGYGDSLDDSGSVTPLSNDGGIDGVIREDKLGFDNIYIQAKRWDLNACVGRPDLQAFVGALTGTGATKGLFITTARFSKGALEYAGMQHAVKLVLVDGDQLARLMIAHNVGVSVRHTYEIKGIDRDYFDIDS